MAGDTLSEDCTVVSLMNGGRLSIGWVSKPETMEKTASTFYRRQRSGRIHNQLRVLASTVSFWGAILLPALYLPLLLQGIESLVGLGLFLALFGLHALALFGGRGHRR